MKILMVCLGNICRSPLAEGIMREKINQHRLPWLVDSAGTGSWHVGNQPDLRSQAVARQHGLDISRQRARQFRPADFQDFDLILAMDHSNYQNIQLLAQTPAQREKVHLILELAGASQDDIPDPYWDDNGFEKVYTLLDGACEKLVACMQVKTP
ncbi:MAG: protein-tyrosine-phosphatase [Bacteroidetes bacterium]|nr:MAG: protein-tyrosine-phosphatase [Bacteroidota bacterium]PTM14760.1 MAG: protein-tyrosine-phosphatase [Bacteroidota bacterium]